MLQALKSEPADAFLAINSLSLGHGRGERRHPCPQSKVGRLGMSDCSDSVHCVLCALSAFSSVSLPEDKADWISDKAR